MKDPKRFFLHIAWLAAQQSTCSRLKVGAVLATEDNFIISLGYNGAPRGLSHCNLQRKVETPCRCVHAEQNALAHSTVSWRVKKVLYTTTFPCYSCAKILIAANVTKVFYKDMYRDMYEAKLLLIEARVKLERVYLAL